MKRVMMGFLLAALLVAGFTSCDLGGGGGDETPPPFVGTWVWTDVYEDGSGVTVTEVETLVLTTSAYQSLTMEIWPGEDPETYGQKGTLTYTTTEVTVTPTHVYNSLSSTWLLIDDLIEAAYWDAEGGPDFDDEFGVYVSDMTLEEYAVIVRESEFPSMTASYSVDGDTLTVTIPLLGSKEYTKE